MEPAAASSPAAGQGELAELLHLRELYEKTTRIASACFDTCLDRPAIGRVEERDRNCLANCAANFLHAELLFMRRLVRAANDASRPAGPEG